MSKERVAFYKEQLVGISEPIREVLFRMAMDDDLSVVEFMEFTMMPLFMVATNEEGNFDEI